MSWTSNGSIAWFGFSWDASWLPDDDFARIDVSGANRQASTSKLATTITGPATVSFTWQTSCQTGKERMFARIDGIEQASCPNVGTWQSGSVFVPFGTHTVDWVFVVSATAAAPDFGSSAALNAIRVDEFLDSEIAVYQPSTAEVESGDSVSFGKVGINKSKSKAFIIRNNGAQPLTNIAARIKGASVFNITEAPKKSLAPGEETRIVVRFTPASYSKASAALKISSSDPDENVITLNLAGSVKKPSPPAFRVSDFLLPTP